MKIKHGVFIGFAAIALAAIFTLTGCEDPNNSTDDGTDNGTNSGNTYTTLSSGSITLAQKASNQFTLTLGGGLKWTDNFISLPNYIQIDGTVTAAGASGDDLAIGGVQDIDYNIVKTSDTILTVTMSQHHDSYYRYFWGAGKLKPFLDSNPSYDGHYGGDGTYNSVLFLFSFTTGYATGLGDQGHPSSLTMSPNWYAPEIAAWKAIVEKVTFSGSADFNIPKHTSE
jgi:hypothetical protein